VLGLARYAMQSPLRTGILAAVFAVLPFLYVLSAGLVALTTLRHGLTAGTRLLLIAMIGALISWRLTGVPLSMLVLTIVTLLAVVLRESRSWSRTLVSGSVIALLFALIAQSQFQAQFDTAITSMQNILTDGDASSIEWQMLDKLKPLVAYGIMASELMEALLSLLLARFWQAGLYNPGGLKKEMHNLRFSRVELLGLVIAVLVSLAVQPGAVLLFGIPFVFSGISLIHGIVAKVNLGGQWLVALYIALIFAYQIIVPLLVLLVLVDSFVDIRQRVPNRVKSDNE